MRVLVLVAQESEVAPMKRLLAKAGMQADVWDVLTFFFKQHPDEKPPMKYLREVKLELDNAVKEYEYDTIIAAGETAARLVLDTSTVNINKLRGRDFEYAYGVKTPGKKKACESE